MIYLYSLLMLISLFSGWFILYKVPMIHSTPSIKMKKKKLSIIIPARNEEKNLPILLKSLKKQSLPPDEILVVDDDSEDKTAEIARTFGARVVQFPTGRTDWVGKAAACQYGAEATSGEWYFFLDADVFLPEKTSLEKILFEYQREETSHVLSIQPYHVVKKLYENLSVIFNLLVLAGMNRFSALQDKLQPAGAFGPSLLIDRETYFDIGGHSSVRGSIMENIDLGNILLEKGVPINLYAGKGSLHFRMYPEGHRSLVEGWSKSFASGSKSTQPLIMTGISLWIFGAFLPVLFFIFGWMQGDFSLLVGSSLGYLFFYFQFVQMASIVGNFSWWVSFFYPLLFLYFIGLFTWSAIQTKRLKRVSWKGREITFEEDQHAD